MQVSDGVQMGKNERTVQTQNDINDGQKRTGMRNRETDNIRFEKQDG